MTAGNVLTKVGVLNVEKPRPEGEHLLQDLRYKTFGAAAAAMGDTIKLCGGTQDGIVTSQCMDYDFKACRKMTRSSKEFTLFANKNLLLCHFIAGQVVLYATHGKEPRASSYDQGREQVFRQLCQRTLHRDLGRRDVVLGSACSLAQA